MRKIILLTLFIPFLSSCDRDLESEGITTGLIRFPRVALIGDEAYSYVAGEGSFIDPGANAYLGDDDISEQVEVSGTFDLSTPGIYPITYSVSVENEIGEQSVASSTRYIVVTEEDVSDTDLSGDYLGSGGVGSPIVVTVTKLASGFYYIPDVLSSTNRIGAHFAHLGGDEIFIPSVASPFGTVTTIAPGAGGGITETGFTWTVYIACCGNFGPINFVKQ